MKRGILVVSVLLGAVLYAHRSGLHQIFTDVALGGVSLAGLCLVAAGLAYVLSRKPVSQVRSRPAAEPAVVVRPRAVRPAVTRCQACGQPASRMSGDQPACEDCGRLLDARLPGEDEPADSIVHQPAGYQLSRPPVLPEGETAGQVDMTEFERRLSS